MKKASQTVLMEDVCYTIAASGGRVLEVADYNTENGALIRLWNYEGKAWQQWLFCSAGDGEYRIKNRFTGKVIDLVMGGTVNGTWLHQWSQTSSASQRWRVEQADNGQVRLCSVKAAGKVIDLSDMRIDNGAQAQIWQDVGGENQCWRLTMIPQKQLGDTAPPPKKTGAPKSTRTQTGRGMRAKQLLKDAPEVAPKNKKQK